MTGFVLKNDLLLAHANDRSETQLKEFKREIQAIPGSHTLFDLFDLFFEKRLHLCLVEDEYGSLEGLVTMEDLIETLLGLEIIDETDQAPDMQILARELWQKRAKPMGLDIANIAGNDER